MSHLTTNFNKNEISLLIIYNRYLNNTCRHNLFLIMVFNNKSIPFYMILMVMIYLIIKRVLI